MLRNYFRIATRHHWKNPLYSAINIGGLAIALTGVILSILYFRDEHSYDLFHRNNPNLYRINTTYTDNKTGKQELSGGTGQMQGPAFKAQLPDIVDYVRIWGGGISENVKTNEKAFNLSTSFVDSGFFKLFSFPLLFGNPSTALNDRQSIVITEKTARKFFGTANVVGKRLEVADNPDSLFASFVISGVAKDPPANSSIQFDVLIPFSYMKMMFDDKNWLNAYLGTFVLTRPHANQKKLEEQFVKIHNAAAEEQLEQARKTGEFDKKTAYSLQPVTSMHLHPYYSSTTSHEGGFSNGSSTSSSYFLLGISFFILLMACVNFINLSIAGSLKRAKEIGVRKISGSSKIQIITQFLVEALIICSMAMLLALLMTGISLPWFNMLAGKQLTFASLSNGPLLFYLICLLFSNILFAGFYPAFILARFKPRDVLYNKLRMSGRNGLGRGLVVFQFCLSACLIISSMVYYLQMRLMRTKDLGYNPNGIVRIEVPPRRDTRSIYTTFRNDLAREPGIKAMSLEASMDGDYKVTVDNKIINSSYRLVEKSYIPLLEIPLKEGRNFSEDFGTDKTNAVIVNEAFVKAAGLTHPIGQSLQANEWFVKKDLVIVGVIKNYHFGSLKQIIQPLVLAMNDLSQGTILVKIEKARSKQSLAALEKTYHGAIPGSEYSYAWWDEFNGREFEQERKWLQIINVATGLSIFICCLGLFGLSNLATHQRLKEIGIRKVFGASVSGIVSLLSVDFLKLVLIGFLIASPVAWWVMHNWLQGFAYRITIGWWVFAATALLIVILALATVSIQTIRAALLNPVKSLRNE